MKMAAKEIVYTTVTMDDGRVVEFAGKRKMLKEALFLEEGAAVRLDFVNGETRTFVIPDSLAEKFAAHGAAQKFGDEIAGLEDVEDCVLAVDALMDRLEQGEWTAKRESTGLAGTSVLARALVEVTGKTPEEVKEFLATKTQAEKVALRSNPRLQPVVVRLESEKTKKASKVDTDALLGELA